MAKDANEIQQAGGTTALRRAWDEGHSASTEPSAEDQADADEKASAARTMTAKPYRIEGNTLYLEKQGRDNVRFDVMLANFDARIVCDVIEDDGAETRRVFEMKAKMGEVTHAFDVPAPQFMAMNWPTEKLGAEAYLAPGVGSKDHTRAAIQRLSGRIPERVIYTHTGWRHVGGRHVYLHAGGAIGADSECDTLSVTLPTSLADYELPSPPIDPARIAAVRASLAILDVAPDRVTVAALGAVWRAPLGNADFSVHIVGPSGNRKTEIAALAQQHWGARWHGRRLPAEWASSANALEALAFQAKDALFTVDDFVPPGTSAADAAQAQRAADRLLRAQGNQAGRQRMRSDTSLRPSKPPRGLILSTGEDVPKGQSLRARMIVTEVGPGDVDLERLTIAQKLGRDGRYAEAMAAYLKWFAGHYDAVRSDYQTRALALRSDAQKLTRHGRTGDAIASLGAAWGTFLRFACDVSAITEAEHDLIAQRVWTALAELAAQQDWHQAASDCVTRYWQLLSAALSSGRAHVASASGRAPENPAAWGWKEEGHDWRREGRCIGWIEDGQLYLHPLSAYAAAQEMGTATNGGVGIEPNTLARRLDQRGFLVSKEPEGKKRRLTIRKTLEGKRHHVLHVSAASLSSADESGPSGPNQSEREQFQSTGVAHSRFDGGPMLEEVGRSGPLAGTTDGPTRRVGGPILEGAVR